jgi:hypothetical protein
VSGVRQHLGDYRSSGFSVGGKFHLNDDDPTRWLHSDQVGTAGSQSHLSPDNR